MRRRLTAVLVLTAAALAGAVPGVAHADVQIIDGGSGPDAWTVFLPAPPRAAAAPLVVVTHGYFEFSGHAMNDLIARHTAEQGNVVIYPHWQTGVATPCPGPFDIEPCLTSTVAGINGALTYLTAHPELPQPQRDRASYFGFSFGGIITANLANRWQRLGLPQPRAIWLDDPHDGGFTGAHEPALDKDLSGIPATAKVVCHSGAHGVFDDDYTGAPNDPDQVGQPKQDGSCNTVFPRLTSVPATNKSLVLTSEDTHGEPALTSDHGVCAGSAPDAYDTGFCWRSFDALRSCALDGTRCNYALGDTPENRYIGTWPDGTPIIGLKIQAQAPIRANPVPDRAPAPPKDLPPTARIASVRRLVDGRHRVRGTATDDHRVARVELAVIRRGAHCRQLTAAGAFSAMTGCRTPTRWLRATGTRSWQITLARRLPVGRYTLVVRVTDNAGQRTIGPRATRAVH